MGEGKVEVTPDVATATLGVETRNVDVAQAVSENITRAQAVVDAVKAAGISRRISRPRASASTLRISSTRWASRPARASTW